MTVSDTNASPSLTSTLDSANPICGSGIKEWEWVHGILQPQTSHYTTQSCTMCTHNHSQWIPLYGCSGSICRVAAANNSQYITPLNLSIPLLTVAGPQCRTVDSARTGGQCYSRHSEGPVQPHTHCRGEGEVVPIHTSYGTL